MAKTSYFGGPSAPNLGARPSIPNKKFPYNISDADFKLVSTEKEKEKDNMRLIKDLVYDYERRGREQLNYIREDILKKYNLAYGVIDQSDYIKGETEYETEVEFLGGESLDFDLKFYPIIPNIVNTLTNFLTKIKVTSSAIALNREAQNEILRQKNDQIRALLIGKAQQLFDIGLEEQGVTPESQPDVYQQQLEIFQALPHIQKYYGTDFRLEVEQWANHRLEGDEKRFQMKSLEKKLFFNKLVCDRPFIHINLVGETYKPEVLRPENCFYLRSPHVEDVSEGIMFGWNDYDSAVNLINRYGDKLSKEDVERLQRFYLSTRFTQHTADIYNKDIPDELAQAQNYIAFRTENRDNGNSKHRGEEYKEHLIEVMHMYLQVPRKLYKLTINTGTQKFSTIVDEDYKIDLRPVYQEGKEKSVDNLVYGEHLETLFINELWRCIKINLTRNPNPDLGEDIWVTLDKYPVQISNPRISTFGSIIPVHGGPMTNEYSPSVSIVDKCKPWQVFYNYLWNRNNQILQTEIGLFLMFNQNAIPQESMGEEWGKNNVIKWLLAARDVGIAPTDNSPINTGQSALQASGGFGQVVDLTRTNEVLQKSRLAEICKQECLSIVGVSPQLLGDISPNETATGVNQGIQKSITQLKHLYDEHFTMMELANQTLLEVAKYCAINHPSVSESYMNDDGERIIFETDTINFPLYQLGVFTTSSFDDSILNEEIRQWAIRDNTLEADTLDRLTLISSKSIGDTYEKLKSLKGDKEKKEQQRAQQEAQQQQLAIEAREREIESARQWDGLQKQLDRENYLKVNELRVIGQAQFKMGDGVEEIQRLKAQQLKEDSYYQSILERAQDRILKQTQEASQFIRDKETNDIQKSLKEKELDIKRENNLTKLKVSKDNVHIAEVNKP